MSRRARWWALGAAAVLLVACSLTDSKSPAALVAFAGQGSPRQVDFERPLKVVAPPVAPEARALAASTSSARYTVSVARVALDPEDLAEVLADARLLSRLGYDLIFNHAVSVEEGARTQHRAAATTAIERADVAPRLLAATTHGYAWSRGVRSALKNGIDALVAAMLGDEPFAESAELKYFLMRNQGREAASAVAAINPDTGEIRVVSWVLAR